MGRCVFFSVHFGCCFTDILFESLWSKKQNGNKSDSLNLAGTVNIPDEASNKGISQNKLNYVSAHQ